MDIPQDTIMAIIGVKEVELVGLRMRVAHLERQLADLSKPIPVAGDVGCNPPDGPGHGE